MLEAGAFAIPHKRLGENVAAVVVLRPNAKVSPQKLRDFVRERLAGFKVPSLIRIVPEIPKGASGKIKEVNSLSRFHNDVNERMEMPRGLRLARNWSRQLAKMWADLLELSKVGVDQDVFALGADSLTLTQMLSRLRERFGVNFSFEDIFDAPTVAALAARLESSKRDHAAVSLSLEIADRCPQRPFVVPATTN